MEKGGSRRVSEGLGGKEGEREPSLGLSVGEEQSWPCSGRGKSRASEHLRECEPRARPPQSLTSLSLFKKERAFSCSKVKHHGNVMAQNWTDSLSDFTPQALQSTLGVRLGSRPTLTTTSETEALKSSVATLCP